MVPFIFYCFSRFSRYLIIASWFEKKKRKGKEKKKRREKIRLTEEKERWKDKVDGEKERRKGGKIKVKKDGNK